MKAIDSGRILKAAGSKKEVIYKGVSLRFTADLSDEMVWAWIQWKDTVKRTQWNEHLTKNTLPS